LEDGRSKDDKMSRRIWEAIEVKTEKIDGKSSKRKKTEEKRKEEGKTKESRMINVKKVAEEWEIWNKEEEAARSEEEVKKLIPKQYHK